MAQVNEGLRNSTFFVTLDEEDEQQAVNPEAEVTRGEKISLALEEILARLRRLFRIESIDIILKGLFVFLVIPWLISVIFFSIYDTKCIIIEQASVMNCTQDFFMTNPRHWVFAWLIMSILSSIIIMLIIALNWEQLDFKIEKAKKIHHKGSFGSLIFLLVVTSIFFIIRVVCSASSPTNLSISVLILLGLPVTAALICCFNYLPQITWTRADENLPCFTFAWLKNSLTKNSNFIIYWLALVAYFVEETIKVAAVMLDAAHEVAPLIESKFPEESGKFRGVMLIAIGFNLAFRARLLSFFWQKLFHGRRDLFSEPSTKLLDDED